MSRELRADSSKLEARGSKLKTFKNGRKKFAQDKDRGSNQR
jgi:hypothetical protein